MKLPLTSIYKMNILILALFCFMLLENHAIAYLDPGLTSYSLQIIAASLVGVLFFARKFLKKIVSFFTNKTEADDGEK
jgi:hypothetical protein